MYIYIYVFPKCIYKIYIIFWLFLSLSLTDTAAILAQTFDYTSDENSSLDSEDEDALLYGDDEEIHETIHVRPNTSPSKDISEQPTTSSSSTAADPSSSSTIDEPKIQIKDVYVPEISSFIPSTIDHKDHYITLEKSKYQHIRFHHPVGRITVAHLRDYLMQHNEKHQELRYKFRFYLINQKRLISREDYEFADDVHVKYVRRTVSKHHKKYNYILQSKKFQKMTPAARKMLMKMHKRRKFMQQFSTKKFYSLPSEIIKMSKTVDDVSKKKKHKRKPLSADKKREKQTNVETK